MNALDRSLTANPPACSGADGTARFEPSPDILTQAAWTALTRRLHLSERDIDIIQGFFSDRTDERIANELGISINTVKTHIKRFYVKLGVSDRPACILRLVFELATLPPCQCFNLTPSDDPAHAPATTPRCLRDTSRCPLHGCHLIR